MRVWELIEKLREHNTNSVVTFSIEDIDSEDIGERWFVEDGIEDIFGNGHPELGVENETVVTIKLLAKSNNQD